jgi:hypothetical protein
MQFDRLKRREEASGRAMSVRESRDASKNRIGDRVPRYGMLRMLAAAVGLASGLTLAQSAPFMIVGNDEKRLWDDQFKPRDHDHGHRQALQGAGPSGVRAHEPAVAGTAVSHRGRAAFASLRAGSG